MGMLPMGPGLMRMSQWEAIELTFRELADLNISV
jgi:hypothetical protein